MGPRASPRTLQLFFRSGRGICFNSVVIAVLVPLHLKGLSHQLKHARYLNPITRLPPCHTNGVDGGLDSPWFTCIDFFLIFGTRSTVTPIEGKSAKVKQKPVLPASRSLFFGVV